ncbi:MAG: hypothetical protein D6682_06950 [Zetaproteobacteria bacterium]|nr:MAG: hypothetical protein D6682_06950 [Zetaproteobacteria bacterium]
MSFDFQDGWTIYIWLISGALILVAVVFGIRWAAKNEQFDEDIKYLVFDEGDEKKMDPAEFAKMREVTEYQEKRRAEILRQREEEARLG